MSYLDKAETPEDLSKLSHSELNLLCGEIRDFLIQNVSQTGGHLASNLGIVEITVALHRIFDTRRDRLVFDVGHQCYVHKLLTGRREGFKSLRQFGGMSGFPRPDESPHDAFAAGHASTAISVALGMARAESSEPYHVIAVIGDGAMTGGLAYEALNDAGQSRKPLIVILNDNGMSITKNVGGIAKILAKARIRPQYFRLKELYHKIVFQMPGGKTIYKRIHMIKNAIKTTFLPSSIFEDMGFAYYGPSDGHNIDEIMQLLTLAKNINGPVLIHLRTIKGKGYDLAEADPSAYHGVARFDAHTGLNGNGNSQSFTSVFGNEIVSLAKTNEKVCAITAAMEAGTGLSEMAKIFPDRFYDVGIAEGHAVTMAAGMAKQSLIPVCAIYSTFLQRSYDMIIHDVCLSNLHVVLAIDRAGLVGQDGETHHGLFDIGFLSQMPYMRVYCPANYSELKTALDMAVLEEKGPVAVRYPRGRQGSFTENTMASSFAVLRKGKDVTLITYGRLINQCIAAAELAHKAGISVHLIKLNVVHPIDQGLIQELMRETKRLVVAEESMQGGCVGHALAGMLAGNAHSLDKLILLNTGYQFIPHGETEKLLSLCGLDSVGIWAAVKEAAHER